MNNPAGKTTNWSRPFQNKCNFHVPNIRTQKFWHLKICQFCVFLKHDELSLGLILLPPAVLGTHSSAQNYPPSAFLVLLLGQWPTIILFVIIVNELAGRILLCIQLSTGLASYSGWTLFNLLISINKRIRLPANNPSEGECGSPNFPIGKQICSIAIVFRSLFLS